MANPNMAAATTIYGNLAVATLTTSTANLVTNSSGSGSVLKMNSITIANYGANNIGASVMVNRSSTSYYLAGNIIVPGNSTLIVLAKDTTLYLQEGDVIQANASANTTASFVASFETIS